MMPLVLFRSAGMRIALLVGFAFMAGWFGTVFFASLFLQQHLGLTPLQAGLAFLPAAIFSMAGNVSSGAITNRFAHAPQLSQRLRWAACQTASQRGPRRLNGALTESL